MRWLFCVLSYCMTEHKSTVVPPVRSTLQECALCVAVWRKAHPPFVYTNTEVKTSRAKDTWSIAPGKVGHRQVTSEEPSLMRWLFCVS